MLKNHDEKDKGPLAPESCLPRSACLLSLQSAARYSRPRLQVDGPAPQLPTAGVCYPNWDPRCTSRALWAKHALSACIQFLSDKLSGFLASCQVWEQIVVVLSEALPPHCFVSESRPFISSHSQLRLRGSHFPLPALDFKSQIVDHDSPVRTQPTVLRYKGIRDCC